MIWYGDNNTKIYSVANVFTIIILLKWNLQTYPGRGTAIYGHGFQAVYSGIGYINQRVGGLEQGIIFQETDRLVKDLSLD